MMYSVAMQVWFIVYGFTGNGIYDWPEFFLYITALAMMLSVRISVDRSPQHSVTAAGELGVLG